MSRRVSRSVFVLLLMLGLPVSLFAQQETARSAPSARPAAAAGAATVPAPIKAALDFVRLAYADLRARPMHLQLRQSGRTVILVAQDDATPDAEPLLSAVLAFTDSGDLESFAATGTVVAAPQNRGLQQQVLAHPEWSTAEVETAARALGARSAAALETQAAQFDAAPWAAALGVHPHVEATALDRAHTRAGRADVPALVTRVRATNRRGVSVVYQFRYEPISGQLVAVTLQ